MKRMIKGLLRACWRATAPIRRRVSPLLSGFIAEAVGGQFAEVNQAIHVTRCATLAVAEDTNLVLDSVVRELARLQRQIEILREVVEEGQAVEGRLALTSEPE
jgi:hypothetical protein